MDFYSEIMLGIFCSEAFQKKNGETNLLRYFNRSYTHRSETKKNNDKHFVKPSIKKIPSVLALGLKFPEASGSFIVAER